MGKKKTGTSTDSPSDELDETIAREYTNLDTPLPSDQGSPDAKTGDNMTTPQGKEHSGPDAGAGGMSTPSPAVKPAGSPTLTAAGKKGGKKGKEKAEKEPSSSIKETDDEGLVSVEEAMRSKNKSKTTFVCQLIKKFTGLQISIEAKEETYKELRKQEGKRRVWPFVLFTTMIMTILLMYDACNIHPPKRKDCGYPGISVTECYIWGKYQSHKDGLKEMIRCLSGWCGLGTGCWWLSGYDVQSLLIYFLLSALATYHQATACYDGHVPPGVPHCYCS